MGKGFKKSLVWFFLPVAVIIILMLSDIWAGTIALAAYILALVILKREKFYTIIGAYNYTRNNIDKAYKWYRRAYNDGKGKPRNVVIYGYLMLKSGKPDEAESIIKNLLQRDIPKEDRLFAKSNLALAIWKKGDLDGAVEILENVFKEYKTSIIYGSLGFLLILKGDLEKALAFNLEAYDYNNSNAVIQDNLGQTYYLRGEIEKAEEIYGKLIPANPSIPEAYYNYGLVLMNKGKKTEAADNFRKALDYRFTYLSTISEEDVRQKIAETEQISQ